MPSDENNSVTAQWQKKQTFEHNQRRYQLFYSDVPIRRCYRLTHASRNWLCYSGAHGFYGMGMAAPVPLSMPDQQGRRFRFSVGPWLVDPNHAAPGYGDLNLIFFTALDPTEPSNKNLPLDGELICPSLRDMKIRGAIRGANVELKGGDLLFWFQCYSSKLKKRLNYALTEQPLNRFVASGEVTPFSLDIDIGAVDQWTSLGSSAERSDLYADLPIESLDNERVINCGFIIAPISVLPLFPDEIVSDGPKAKVISSLDLSWQAAWPMDPSLLPTGCIALYELEIEHNSHYRVQLC